MPKSTPKTKAKEIIKDFPKQLNTTQRDELLTTLEERFTAHPSRHDGLSWDAVKAKLTGAKLAAVYAMEITGGEPDVVLLEGTPMIVDCAAESPTGRRSVCYDQEALDSRKTAKPQHSAVGMCKDMGVELLDEDQCRALQEYGPFDQKTSSWVKTPAQMRELGGALNTDYRYGRLFFYHNGAESYYSSRGFRAAIKL